MLRVVVIGSGNVAHHFIQKLAASNRISHIDVLTRSVYDFTHQKVTVLPLETTVKSADIVIIAVSDNAIETIAENLQNTDALIVHTSGSTEMDVLSKLNRFGVLYPLQTFSKNKPVDFTKIPIAVEANNKKDLDFLLDFASILSNHVVSINSDQRKALHVSAVFVCNFVNHLYQFGYEICEQHNLDFNLLRPLIEETANKVSLLTPAEAQTGPAKRHDTVTINKHLAFLKDENLQEFYKLFTKSIIDHGKKL